MDKFIKRKTFSWWLINHLNQKHNIKSAFLMTGGGVFHICNALAEQGKFIKSIFFYHEQQAAFAAEGISKLTNDLSLVIGTSGPGATNLITGLVSAYQDSTPVIAITGQCKSNDYALYEEFKGLRQAGTFDNDFTKFSKTYTKKVIQIRDVKNGILQIEQAIYIAKSGRPGPVIIEIPLDVQGTLIDENDYIEQLNNLKEDDEQIQFIKTFDKNISDDLIKIISKNKKIVILAGRGCSISSSWQSIYKICEKFNLPLVTTYPAKEENLKNFPWWCGVVGLKGSYSGNSVLTEADLIISLGNSLHQQTVGWELEIFLKNKSLIYVDIDKVLCEKFSSHEEIFAVNLELKYFIELLFASLSDTQDFLSKSIQNWSVNWQKHKRKKSIIQVGSKLNEGFSLYDVIDEFNKISSEDSIIVADSGTTWYVTGQTLLLKNGQSFITNSAMGSMGFALPAAIGISFASKKHVYCLVGDGSLMTSLSALWTISRENLAITIIVINNLGYNSISNTQEKFGESGYFGSTYKSGLPEINIRAISDACSIEYVEVKNVKGFNLDILAKRDTPLLLDVFIDKKTIVVPFVKSILQNDGSFKSGTLNNLEPKI